MLEKELSRNFMDTFTEYTVWTPNNRTTGWPDKGIQLGNRMIWFELKIVPIQYRSPSIIVHTLTNGQAAWLAKWQKAGGLCFLFLGLIDHDNNFYKYGILKCFRWDMWLEVPKRPVLLEQLAIQTNSKSDILNWFTNMFEVNNKHASRAKA
jgi:hypothetical protein